MPALVVRSIPFAAAALLLSCTTTPPASPAASAAPGGSAASIASAPPAPSAATPAASAGPGAAASAQAPAAAENAQELVGRAAPDFSAPAHDGSTFRLSAAKGKPVVLYFYPKDETPGCTKEACSFRDAWEALAKTGAVLVGISADGTESHRAFAGHWKLPFLLLSDPDGAIGRLYGVPFEGHHKRQTFVIGPDGVVRKVYRLVDVGVHAKQVLGDVAALGQPPKSGGPS